MAESSGNPFWDFTLSLYGRPGVAPALIGLQDRRGLDVNMLLFCCWAGTAGRVLSEVDLTAVETVAEPWQAEVVRPLRALRRRLKGGFGSFPPDQVETYRKRLNALEIDGERLAQDRMAASLGPPPAGSGAPAAADVAGNLQAYLRLRGVKPASSDHADLMAVLAACCPNQDCLGIRFDAA